MLKAIGDMRQTLQSQVCGIATFTGFMAGALVARGSLPPDELMQICTLAADTASRLSGEDARLVVDVIASASKQIVAEAQDSER
jgi:hypothetical protein